MCPLQLLTERKIFEDSLYVYSIPCVTTNPLNIIFYTSKFKETTTHTLDVGGPSGSVLPG